MKILMIAINDPAGTAIAFTKAINRYTNHTCRLITREIRYNFMFEKDIHLPWLDRDGWEEVEWLLRESDLFHFHMTADEYIELGPFRPVDYIKGKTLVHHHHGHPDFRGNPLKYREKYKRLKRENLLVSTPDLLKLLPDAKWQPNLVPIDDPLYRPLEKCPLEKSPLEKNPLENSPLEKSPVIICHSPTRRELKNTDQFLQAVDILRRKSKTAVELRLIDNTPHIECLRLKQESHILFDHMQGYYGVSSLEGLSQGLCVIAGLDEWNISHIKEFTGAETLPWLPATPQTLQWVLEDIVEHKDRIPEYAAASRSFMEGCWSEEKVLGRLLSIYGFQDDL
ncbi:MAG: glycosyltransferase [Desulfamplus sp.]|nr:glycosyltransferase [Desulfamplus sp.]